MSTINNAPTINKNYVQTSEMAAVSADIERAKVGGGVNIHILLSKLGMMTMAAAEKKLVNHLEKMKANLDAVTMANQNNADLMQLRAMRTKDDVKDSATMTTRATDTDRVADKIRASGVALTDDEIKNWESGNVTEADIKSMEAKVKVKLDQASNLTQGDNMVAQQLMTQMGQFTNFVMFAVDNMKEIFGRIFR